jgi:uncharacterized membrane protein YvbJ
MYCKKCGKQVDDQATFCPYCGENLQQQSNSSQPTANKENDQKSVGFDVLAFFFPLIGLILYLVWKETYPIRAKDIGKWALIGFIVGIVLGFISGLFSTLSILSAFSTLS